jgi:hypothetical protein
MVRRGKYYQEGRALMQRRGRVHILFTVLLLLPFALPAVALAKTSRPWDFSLRLLTEFDDNVPLVSDASTFSGDKDSIKFGVVASGSYIIVRNAAWQAGFGGTVMQTVNIDSDVNDYNLTSLSPSFFARYYFDLRGRPAETEMAYTLRADWLGGNRYATSNVLLWDLRFHPRPAIRAGIYYHLFFDDFTLEGTEPVRTSRDADRHALGVKGTYTFSQGLRAITVNYEYGKNNAEGSNFVFSSHKIAGRFTTRLMPPLWLVLDVSFTDQDYTDYTPQPRRTQDNLYYRVMLLLPVSVDLTFDLSFSRSKYNGSQSRFDAERDRLGLGATFTF